MCVCKCIFECPNYTLYFYCFDFSLSLSHMLHRLFHFYCPLFFYTISLFQRCFLLLLKMMVVLLFVCSSVKCIHLLFILMLFTPFNIRFKEFFCFFFCAKHMKQTHIHTNRERNKHKFTLKYDINFNFIAQQILFLIINTLNV